MSSTPPSTVQGSPSDLLFGLSLKKKALFFSEMATLVDAGVSIVKASHMAAEHSVPGIAGPVAKALDGGLPLSAVLARYPTTSASSRRPWWPPARPGGPWTGG